MSSKKQKDMTLKRFQRHWPEDSLLNNNANTEYIASEVRELKRYQQTLRATSKEYRKIQEYLESLQAIKPNININTSTDPSIFMHMRA